MFSHLGFVSIRNVDSFRSMYVQEEKKTDPPSRQPSKNLYSSGLKESKENDVNKEESKNRILTINDIHSKNEAFQQVFPKTVNPIRYTPIYSTSDDFYIEDVITNHQDSRKKIHSTLKIAKVPHLQCHKKIYPHPSLEPSRPAAQSSFAHWTLQEQQEAITTLNQLGIPLRNDTIQKIYALLRTHEKSLCENPHIHYPALYKVTGIYEDEETKELLGKAEIELEIHSNKKATLIFPEIEENLIGKGASKHVWKVFSLGYPKLTAYTTSLQKKNADKIAAREEQCFIQFKGCDWLPKIYNIFYYQVIVNGHNFQQQIIEMKYYSGDLDVAIDAIHKIQPLNLDSAILDAKAMQYFESESFLMKGEHSQKMKVDPIKSGYCSKPCIDLASLTAESRLNNQLIYSIQLMQAIADLHVQGIVHRDIKPENILMSNKGIVLNDFGLSMHQLDPEFKHTRSGSFSFISPEILVSDENKYDLKMDIWSAGCVLWLLWIGYDNVFEWYDETLKKSPEIDKILEKMREFENSSVGSNHPIKFIIWNMLRFDPKDRWDAFHVLNAFKNIFLEMKLKSQSSSS